MTFEEFAAERLTTIVRFATVLTGDPALAEDVVQEVLIRVYARWGKIACLDRPELYVRKMVVNEYLSWRRRRRPVIDPIDPDLLPTGDPADAAAERMVLLVELARLPPRQRTVVVLHYYEGLAPGEIAELLGCGASTVRGYLFRALARLRVRLDESCLSSAEEGT